MPATDTDLLPAPFLTTAKVGQPPTPETIRQGTVWMEYHPDYEAVVQNVEQVGFEIKVSGFARVDWIEVYNQEHNLLRLEKVINVIKNMRYLDLEHELGHVSQLKRFGDTVPPTDKILELPDGRRTKYKIRDGVLTTRQDTVTEYHNRLVEFIRLYERGVDIELLIEHAGGVNSAFKDYNKKGTKGGRSTKIQPWINKYFADLDDLEKQYHEIKQSLGI